MIDMILERKSIEPCKCETLTPLFCAFHAYSAPISTVRSIKNAVTTMPST